MTRLTNIILVFLFILSSTASAQYDDTGIWLSGKVDQRVYKKWEFSGELASRFNQNFTGISSLFTDLSAEYKLAKPVDLSVTYRVGFSPDDDGYFLSRQRWAFDASFGEKLGDIKLSYRLRYQASNRGASSLEGNRNYGTSYRNKFGASLDLNKKWDVEGSVEFWTEKNDSNWLISDMRIKLGFDHRLKKRRYISAGILHQRHVSGMGEREYMLYFGYSYSLKRIKRSTDNSNPEEE